MDFGAGDRERVNQEAEEVIRAKEAQLIKKRSRIIAKLSLEDQEELAQIDLEWDNLKRLKAHRELQ